MKKTLEEEKQRILEISRKVAIIEGVTEKESLPEGEIDEGNAFSGAAAKAKEEGKDTFEFEGKTYDVK